MAANWYKNLWKNARKDTSSNAMLDFFDPNSKFNKGLSLAGGGLLSWIKASEDIDATNTAAEQDIISKVRANPAFANMSDREILGMLDVYKSDDNDFSNLWGLLGDQYSFDTDSALADLARLSQFSEPMPTAPDFTALYKEAQDTINAENADILAMYDADLQRRTDLYNQQMADSNAAYNRNVEQILSNDYQKNAQLLGTMRSEMNRSQRNALEAGASAGIRIAGNINTMLSMQNRQSQQSLETSNNLAQMLLNQQQANAGLRNEYSNYLSQDAANRAALKSGTAERVDNHYMQRVNTEQFKYDTAEDDYNRRYTAAVGDTNPFANAYQNYYRNSQYNTAK